MLWIICPIVWAVCIKNAIYPLSFVNSSVEKELAVPLGPGAGHRRRLTEGQESANRQRKVQCQSRLRSIEVYPGDFIDAIHSIKQGVAMHNQ